MNGERRKKDLRCNGSWTAGRHANSPINQLADSKVNALIIVNRGSRVKIGVFLLWRYMCRYVVYRHIFMLQANCVKINLRHAVSGLVLYMRNWHFLFPKSTDSDRLFIVAVWNRADHYIFILWFLLLLLLSSSPNLSRRRSDVCHTSTHGVALVQM